LLLDLRENRVTEVFKVNDASYDIIVINPESQGEVFVVFVTSEYWLHALLHHVPQTGLEVKDVVVVNFGRIAHEMILEAWQFLHVETATVLDMVVSIRVRAELPIMFFDLVVFTEVLAFEVILIDVLQLSPHDVGVVLQGVLG